MRSDRRVQAAAGVALTASAVLVILIAAPAASTSGGAHPASNGGAERAAAHVLAAPAPEHRSVSFPSTPLDESALMRTAGTERRHLAWVARRRASKGVMALRSSASGSSSAAGLGGGGSVRDLVIALFTRIAGPGQVRMALCVADRESHFNPHARNPYSSAAGVFQWVSSSWRSYSARYGFGGASVFDAYANVSVAAHAVADGGWGPWGGGCW